MGLQTSPVAAAGAGMPPTQTEELPEKLATDAAEYWMRSASNDWVRDMSHWRGRGRWADDVTWAEIGAVHVGLFRQLCRLVGRDQRIGRMVEWGPGGGANAVAFSGLVDEFYGVDISAPNLEECGRQLATSGFHGWRPVFIDPARPWDCRGAIAGPVDFFLSTAVFQHFPGKAYGVRVMSVAADLLCTDGVAIIQTRYDDGSAELRPKHRNYAKNVVTFTSYGIDEFWELASDAGLEPVSVLLKPQDRYAYYLLRKAAGKGL